MHRVWRSCRSAPPNRAVRTLRARRNERPFARGPGREVRGLGTDRAMEAWYHPLHGMNDPQAEGHMASYIERRKFLATLGGAAAARPVAARAQQPAMPVVGFVGSSSAQVSVKNLEAFRKGL